MKTLLNIFFRWGEVPLSKKSYALSLILYLFIYLPYTHLLPPAIAVVGPILSLVSIIPYLARLRSRALFSSFLMACATYYTFQIFGSVFGLLPGVAFLTMLAPLKLFELTNKRDLYLYSLVLVLLLAGLVVSVDSFYALIHVAFSLFAIFLMLASYDPKTNRFRSLGSRRRVLASIFLFSLPTTLVLFLLFPRLQWGNMLFNENSGNSLSGFSETLEPGRLQSIVRDNSAFFRVIFETQEIPKLSNMYWRGAVLTKMEGFYWKHGSGAREKIGPDIDDPEYVYRILFENRGSGPIFTLEDTLSVNPLMRGRLYTDVGSTFRIDTYSRTPLNYRALTGKKSLAPLRERERKAMIELGEGVSDKLKNFVKSFHPNLAPRERINKFLRYIQSEKFHYSLSPGSYSQMSGLDEFFFDRRVGFCEHYASLIGVVGRLMGIPTRVVVGFHGGILNPYGNYYLIRGGDAHAWAEMWLDGRGWQRIDPVQWIAPSRIELGATEYFDLINNYEGGFRRFLTSGTSNLMGELLLGLDLVFFRLNQAFIAYDMDAQRDFLASLGLERLSRFELTLIAFFAFFLSSLPLLIVAMLRAKRGERSQKLFEKLIFKLKQRGITVHSWHGPDALAALVRSSDILGRDEVATHLQTFASLKYSVHGEDRLVRENMCEVLKKGLAVLSKSKRRPKHFMLE